jgi:hypothetical protein
MLDVLDDLLNRLKHHEIDRRTHPPMHDAVRTRSLGVNTNLIAVLQGQIGPQ